MNSLRKVFPKPNIIKLIRTYTSTDPGINRRRKALHSKELPEEFQEDFDDYEADFMNVNKTHKEHINDLEAQHEREKLFIVQQKYFKEKYPNFLTWNDKEQMKYLYNTDPEEWTIDKLSEGFPALPNVVEKIVKAKWTKKATKVVNHDAVVQKNWQMFKRGEMTDLPEELVEHLKKFTNRALNFKPFNAPVTKKIELKQTTKIGEFSKIITSYEEIKNKNHPSEVNNENLIVNTQEKLFIKSTDDNKPLRIDNKKVRGRNFTLEELQEKVLKKASLGKNLSEEEKLLLSNLRESSENYKNLKESSEHNQIVELNDERITKDVIKHKFEPTETVHQKSTRDFSHLIYPEKITIPKEIWKKGCTYKLNDCFYDTDGEFLYRVPGME